MIDDLIAYRISDDEIFLVPNAANAAEVVRRLTEAAPEGITVTDEHDRYAVLAVQGPASERVLEAMGLPAAHDYMSFVTAPYEGADVLVCRTGYTGEHGYELIVPTDHAVKVWDALFAEGAPYSIRACGLGARDTLRTEMGYPLHGQDLSPEITPLQARCGWAVAGRNRSSGGTRRCGRSGPTGPGGSCGGWWPPVGASPVRRCGCCGGTSRWERSPAVRSRPPARWGSRWRCWTPPRG